MPQNAAAGAHARSAEQRGEQRRAAAAAQQNSPRVHRRRAGRDRHGCEGVSGHRRCSCAGRWGHGSRARRRKHSRRSGLGATRALRGDRTAGQGALPRVATRSELTTCRPLQVASARGEEVFATVFSGGDKVRGPILNASLLTHVTRALYRLLMTHRRTAQAKWRRDVSFYIDGFARLSRDLYRDRELIFADPAGLDDRRASPAPRRPSLRHRTAL